MSSDEAETQHRAARKALLLAESAYLRVQLGEDWHSSIAPALAVTDSVRDGVKWLHHRRWWIAAGAAAVVIFKPKAALRRATGLATKGWGLWHAWQRWRPTLEQAWGAYQVVKASMQASQHPSVEPTDETTAGA